MSNFLALTFAIKHGSEETVERLFTESGRPDHQVVGDDGSVKGELLCTTVFMKDQTVVRVIEFDGDFVDVARHMSRQAEVRELEDQLSEHLVVPRDMSTPAGAAAFFVTNSMRCVLARRSGT